MSQFWEPDNLRLKQIIQDNAHALAPAVIGIGDPVYILGAIASVESSFGEKNIPRHEPAYMPGGHYYETSMGQQGRWGRWKILSALSYSSFQIMYPTACELGYDFNPWDRHPIELWDDRIAIQYVIKYLIKRVTDKMVDKSLDALFDGYNSGNPRDAIVPVEYIQRARKAYDSLIANKAI